MALRKAPVTLVVIAVSLLLFVTSYQKFHRNPSVEREAGVSDYAGNGTIGIQFTELDSGHAKPGELIESEKGKRNASDLLSPEAEFEPLTQEEMDGIERIVIFVGYTRSCHTIIAQMLNSHQNIVMANHFGLLNRGLRKAIPHDKESICNALYYNSWRVVTKLNGLHGIKPEKGYSLLVNTSWQGRHSELKVIGDKGGRLYCKFSKQPQKCSEAYHDLVDSIGIPIYYIHVVRNPYDMMATQEMYSMDINKGTNIHDMYYSGIINATHKYNGAQDALFAKTKITFGTAKSIQGMMAAVHPKLLEVHCQDFVREPLVTLARICEFLEVECSQEYLKVCSDMVFPSTKRSRDVLVWNQDLLDYIEGEMRTLSFFSRYTFQND